MYDVIGDVHGQGGKLKALLAAMGYVQRAGAWHAPQGRQAVFVGDLIDRGPDQLGVLNMVRSMVDAGQARVVMGNHEFNAIGLAQRDGAGVYLRPRSPKNLAQHARFLDEVGLDSAEHAAWVAWFRTLPMALDLGGIRVVHAWWNVVAAEAVAAARGGAERKLSDELVHALYHDAALKQARKLLTCGVEWDLPTGATVVDKEGQKHGEARLAVWRHWANGLRDIAIVPAGSEDAVPDIPVPAQYRLGAVQGTPILFGHHWFNGPVKLETPKVACLDWSAAKGGPLVAYRWDGEKDLLHSSLVAAGGDLS